MENYTTANRIRSECSLSHLRASHWYSIWTNDYEFKCIFIREQTWNNVFAGPVFGMPDGVICGSCKFNFRMYSVNRLMIYMYNLCVRWLVCIYTRPRTYILLLMKLRCNSEEDVTLYSLVDEYIHMGRCSYIFMYAATDMRSRLSFNSAV